MNVKELMALLKELPPDMEIFHSDGDIPFTLDVDDMRVIPMYTYSQLVDGVIKIEHSHVPQKLDDSWVEKAYDKALVIDV